MTTDQAQHLKHIYDAYRAQLRAIASKHRKRVVAIADERAQTQVRTALNAT